jgi:hypothetical protein
MNTEELRIAYNIEFNNNVLKIGDWPAKIDKSPMTISEELTEFLCSWTNSDAIDEMLIPSINEVLNETNEWGQTQGGRISVEMTPVEASFYYVLDYSDGSDDNIVYSDYYDIPLQDFYDIVLLWRDFLLTQPLNGTIVDANGNPVNNNGNPV